MVANLVALAISEAWMPLMAFFGPLLQPAVNTISITVATPSTAA